MTGDRTQIVYDEHGRPEPPVAAGELKTLVGFLEYHRSTLDWKTSGLDRLALSATTADSAMTLGGLLKHMAWVEDYWFSVRLHGNDPHDYWTAVNWDADPDWEWNSATKDSPEELRRLWNQAVEASRRSLASALETGGLDQLASRPWSSGNCPSLRWILAHMIEEYARHNGHADLLRESIDGQTGE